MNPILILWVGGGLAVVLLLVGIIISISSERSLVEERLGQYVDSATLEDQQKQKATPLTDWLNRRVEGSSWGDKISKKLARADIKMKPGEYIALNIIAAVGVGFVLWFIGGQSIVSGLIGAVIGLFLPRNVC